MTPALLVDHFRGTFFFTAALRRLGIDETLWKTVTRRLLRPSRFSSSRPHRPGVFAEIGRALIPTGGCCRLDVGLPDQA